MPRQPWWPPKLYRERPLSEWDNEMHIAAKEREESLELMDAAWRQRIETTAGEAPINEYWDDPAGLLEWFAVQLLEKLP